MCDRPECEPPLCRHDPLNCDDGNSCTVDSCSFDPSHPGSGGGCVHETQPAGTACDDGNACTIDRCDPATGACVRDNNPGSCDDGNLCTENDACSGGNCLGSPRVCDDGNVCTTSDTCSNGICGGAPISCDDGRDCTLDSCNPRNGCVHAYDARLPDTDSDGVPDSCDNCPAAANRLQLDCNANGVGDACDPSLYDVQLLTNTAQGKGSGEVVWSTVCETDLRGFDILVIDNQGNRTRLNNVPIPCSACITGGSDTYSTKQ